MKGKISLAPMQGYTDWVFREAYEKYISAIDEYYSPYILLQNDGSIKNSQRREVEPMSARGSLLVPQFMGGSSKECMPVVEYLTGLGYERLNWNLGCPFPMVAKRGRGSGLLAKPDIIRDILDDLFSRSNISLSVKVRLGYDNDLDIFEVLKIFNQFPLTEVIVHPRIGKQLYKGGVNLDLFEQCLNESVHPVAYNGDLYTYADYQRITARFPSITHCMIGRGVLQDLWLPDRIKGNTVPQGKQALSLLKDFHNHLFQIYSELLSGDTQLLMRIKPMWEYFSMHFANSKKVYKGIKKAHSLKNYDAAVNFAFQMGLKSDDTII